MWRILIDGSERETEPLTAGQIADRLWAAQEPSLWARATEGDEEAFPYDLAQVRELLAADPARVARAFLSQTPDWVFGWVMNWPSGTR